VVCLPVAAEGVTPAVPNNTLKLMKNPLFTLLGSVASCGVAFSWTVTAQELPSISRIVPVPGGDVRIDWTAPQGELLRLETSEDLVRWRPWITLRSSGTGGQTDAAAPHLKSRFYRSLPVSDAETLTGDHLETEVGDAVIHPVNHASFVIQWNGIMIYNDPVGGAGAYSGLPPADLILVSHSHGDHFSAATLSAVLGPEGAIVAPRDVFNSLSAALRARTTVLANGEETDWLGVGVEAVPAYNSRHSRGSGNGYVVTVGGRRLYMSGDTGDVAEMRSLENIDVAFLCMNVPFTMTITEAASAVRDFRPRVVYPYHYRNQDSTLSNLESFKAMVGLDGGTEVRIRNWY
jgi:L-ascorbate metabolism protein UlaG (beta-lactamase superfamily)